MSNKVTALRPLERSLLSSLREIVSHLAQEQAEQREAHEEKVVQPRTRKRRRVPVAVS
jgi:hypothetical protein